MEISFLRLNKNFWRKESLKIKKFQKTKKEQ